MKRIVAIVLVILSVLALTLTISLTPISYYSTPMEHATLEDLPPVAIP